MPSLSSWKKFAPILAVLALLPFASNAGMSSANYQIPNDVIGSAGAPMSSASYTMNSTLGQSSPLGESSSSGYHNYPGFWQADECVYDPDADGLFNCAEYGYLTDPYDFDTDDDLLGDGEEVVIGGDGYVTDPLDPDTDADTLDDGDEQTNGTNPTNPDTDGDGLADGVEVVASIDPLYWDTDGDGLPDKFEFDNGASAPPLNPANPADGPQTFDTDSNSNANEYWNGTGLWTKNPEDFRFSTDYACGYWGESDGDCVAGPADFSSLTTVIMGFATDYSNVIPGNGKTQDLDGDDLIGPGDSSLLESMVLNLIVPNINTTATSLTVLSSPSGSVAVGDTTHITIGVGNNGGNRTPGIAVHFKINPSSTGTATLLGGEYTAADSARIDYSMYDVTNASSNIVLRPDSPGNIIIDVYVPSCGVPGVGRNMAAFSLGAPVVITAVP